jgi:hypothetical protein
MRCLGNAGGEGDAAAVDSNNTVAAPSLGAIPLQDEDPHACHPDKKFKKLYITVL